MSAFCKAFSEINRYMKFYYYYEAYYCGRVSRYYNNLDYVMTTVMHCHVVGGRVYTLLSTCQFVDVLATV